MTTPVVPAKSMITAFGPRRRMPGTSRARIISKRLAGSMYVLIQPYSGDSLGRIPNVVSVVGTK